MWIERKLAVLDLELPPPIAPPPGVIAPLAWMRRHGDRIYLSGHGPQSSDGSVAEPLGRVGADVTPEQAYRAARLAALSMLASLQRALGDLDRVAAWLMVFGHVRVAPDFIDTTRVMNGFSDLIVELYGVELGAHARTAIGVAELPLGCPVLIAAEVAVLP